MKKILCLVVCAVFAAALPARAQSDEYRDAVAEMMELTGALRNADVVMTQMVGYLKTSAPSVSEAVWEKIISKFNEKMRARMVDIYVPIYSKYLTLADLRELNALYATPVMRKARCDPCDHAGGHVRRCGAGTGDHDRIAAGTAGRRIRIAACRVGNLQQRRKDAHKRFRDAAGARAGEPFAGGDGMAVCQVVFEYGGHAACEFAVVDEGVDLEIVLEAAEIHVRGADHREHVVDDQ